MLSVPSSSSSLKVVSNNDNYFAFILKVMFLMKCSYFEKYLVIIFTLLCFQMLFEILFFCM
jgi:hypothetical protein